MPNFQTSSSVFSMTIDFLRGEFGGYVFGHQGACFEVFLPK